MSHRPIPLILDPINRWKPLESSWKLFKKRGDYWHKLSSIILMETIQIRWSGRPIPVGVYTLPGFCTPLGFYAPPGLYTLFSLSLPETSKCAEPLGDKFQKKISYLEVKRCEKRTSRTRGPIEERMEKRTAYKRKSLEVLVFQEISSRKILLDPKSFHKTVPGR